MIRWMTIWLAVLMGLVVHAEDPGDETTHLPELVVTAEPSQPTDHDLKKEDLTAPNRATMGEILLEVPGVWGVRRSGDMTEPVIRGLGWERVQTIVDGLPLYGSCPARMDPPVNYLDPEAVRHARVELALPSVTFGPTGTGGRVMIDSGRLPEATEQLSLGGWMQATWNEGRQGPRGTLGLEGASPALSWQAAVSGSDLQDYNGADGTRVPADHESYSSHLALELRPAAGHTWRHTYLYTYEEDIEYPALPMDADYAEFQAYTTRYRIDNLDGFLSRLELRFGVQQIDHLMSNTDKSNRNRLAASTPTTSTTYAAGINATLKLSDNMDLTLGGDTTYLERNAIRTRRIVMSGATSRDALWPAVTQQDIGAFVQLDWQPDDSLDLRLGLRADRVRSDADRTDSPSLQNRTVRQQYVAFYGPAAADVEDQETLYAANLLATWHLDPRTDIWAGFGFSERPASVTERYFAFAPAPGGFQIGNPTLDPEQKLTVTSGLDWRHRHLDVRLSGYHYWMHDYILPTAIARQDVNMDGRPDIIRGYDNIDAVLYGGEIAITVKPTDHWSLPVSAAYVRGINVTDSRDLPEIPPLDIRAALRADYGTRHPWWAQLGIRYAAEQNQIDEQFPEDETAAFTVVHLRCGIQLLPSLKLEAGVENLFDEAYHEHLTREAALATGDLQAGDEIPAPERTWYASIRWTF